MTPAATSELIFHDVPVSKLDDFPDALHDISTRHIYTGLIIRGFMDPEVLKRVAAQLTPDGPLGKVYVSDAMRREQFLQFLPPEHIPKYIFPDNFGEPIIGCQAMDHYFAVAKEFRAQCRMVFGADDFEARLASVLERMGGGRKARVPTSASGQSFSPATIRVLHPQGAEIKVHVGNDFKFQKAADELMAQSNPKADQLSFFMPITAAERGGELWVYDREFNEEEAKDPTRQFIVGDEVVAGNKWKVLSPGAGDLIVFNGGRWYHRVTQVEGSTSRRTIGGFMQVSKDDSTYFFFS